MVLTGATLWGLSGTAAQQLFQWDGFTPTWLVTVRMGISGILLLAITWSRLGGHAISGPWREPTQLLRLWIFALLGLLGVQYSYMASIRLGNAATATFLQYLGPALIVLYVAVHSRRWPSRRELLALSLAVAGTFLLVTNGSIHAVVVPASAVVWGLVSAVTLAFYTLFPANMMRRYGTLPIIGWAMFLGGLVCSLAAPPWRVQGQHWTMGVLLLVGFVVIFGTLLAFYLYLASTRYISATEAGLAACVEPLSAAGASVLWLHTHLGIATLLGGLSILGTVVVLNLRNWTSKNQPIRMSEVHSPRGGP